VVTPGERTLGLTGASPGIITLERLIEAEHIREIEARVGGLTDEKAEVHEREHNVPEICGGANAPVIEHQARHDAVAVEREVPRPPPALDP